MSSIRLLNQPLGGQVGNYIKDCLEDSKYNKLTIIVAFAKNSGVLRLKESLEAFRKSGGEIDVYVGIDLDGTSYEALVSLLRIVFILSQGKLSIRKYIASLLTMKAFSLLDPIILQAVGCGRT